MCEYIFVFYIEAKRLMAAEEFNSCIQRGMPFTKCDDVSCKGIIKGNQNLRIWSKNAHFIAICRWKPFV